MSTVKLGKLQEVDLRKIWAHEQYNFSKWLSSEDNIKELGDTLNLSLTDVETERFVGSYRCDILCKDELTGKKVLIENQLEQSNHDHLGKIITYASGLDAGVIIWIVANAREEHASAIEWLNQHTDEEIAFFLIEIHAYTIGNSEPAPMFKVIEQPNDFVKTVKSISAQGELNETLTSRLVFWNLLNDTLDEKGRPFKKRNPTTAHEYNIAINSPECKLSIALINKEHKIRISLWIINNKQLFDELFSRKDEIEQKVGNVLVWNRINNRKAALISLDIAGLDFTDQSNFKDLAIQAIDWTVVLRNTFELLLKG